MEVGEAVAARRSVRAFRDEPVAPGVLRSLAVQAARAATGGNLQPWHVDIVHGEAMARLKAIMAETLASGRLERAAYDIYPRELTDPYRARRFGVGQAMYAHLGIPREDKAARLAWFANNFAFFGAPAAYFVTVDRRMGPPQWADLGMYLQALMLLAVGEGLGTCAQEAWAVYSDTVAGFLATPAERMVFCGVAIGWEDAAAPVNRLRSARADPDEWLRVVA
ncbi:nitroreductase [Sphingomonas sp.]|uniref:nitroreductase n=1 Tax=Sphingomonas sp. TaxID=28214 RepID=UPI0035BBF9DB